MRTPLLLAAAFLAPAVASTPAASQPAGCESAKPAKKGGKGLGGLLSKVRGSGLIGSVVGAAGGDGDFKADLAGVAKDVAVRAAEAAAACAYGSAAASGNEDTTARAAAGHPTAANQSGSRHPASTGLSSPSSTASAVRYPSELPEPPGFAATKAAFDEFGKDACKECEGGFAFDSWPAYPRDEFSSKYNGKAQRIGSWPIGHVHRWKGNVSTGTLTVVGEETVGGFRCRTLHYRLTRDTTSAERPGLLCWGKANSFAGRDSWNEVY